MRAAAYIGKYGSMLAIRIWLSLLSHIQKGVADYPAEISEIKLLSLGVTFYVTEVESH